MQGIKAWAAANPAKLQEALNYNASYVFFRELPAADGPIGALNIALTAEYSLAVDRRFVPLGSPVYLASTYPLSEERLERLVAAHDTGGAIRGVVRADFFWGGGKDAGALAGRMRQQGKMWLLWPRGEPLPRKIRGSQAAGDALAVDEDQRRGAVHAESAPERKVLVDGTFAGAAGGGSIAAQRKVEPGFAAVRRAPHRLRLLRQLRPDHRVHEHIDGDVVELLQGLLELLAGRAVGIGEHGEDALAAPALDFHRLLERQRVEADGVELAQALFGEVAVGSRLVDLAADDVAGACVRVDHLHSARPSKADLVEPRHRRGLDALDFRAAQLGFHHATDLRLVGAGDRGQQADGH